MGESRAKQQTKDAAGLALDRRVDVWSSSQVFSRPEFLDKTEYDPGVLRIRYMQWILADFEETKKHRDDMDDWTAPLKRELVDRLDGKINPDANPLAPGKEREWERLFITVDATHRVNHVFIDAKETFTIGLAGNLYDLTRRNLPMGRPVRRDTPSTMTGIFIMNSQGRRWSSWQAPALQQELLSLKGKATNFLPAAALEARGTGVLR